MPLFNELSINGSGLHAYRKWMDAISDNIANINTTSATNEDAFRERFVQVQSANVNRTGGGVVVNQIRYGSGEGRIVNQPENPIADAEGNVKLPNIDLASQMTSLIVAQRAYQANVQAIERARNAYQQALTLGK